MRKLNVTSVLLIALSVASAAAVVAVASGCGDSGGNEKTTSGNEAGEQPEPSEEAGGAVPASLGQVESGAEDTIDLARRRDRRGVVRTARELRRVARGRAAADLRKAGAPATRIATLQQRARLLAGLAPRATFVRVSLAANEISALMPEFYGRYEDPVPPDVLKLDYLDREAQLRSLAGDRESVGFAVERLSATWTSLQVEVVNAGGDVVAARYARHVRAMRRLVRGSDDRALQKEAATGLELVDELENQFRRQ